MAGIGEIGVNVTADTAQFTAGMDRVAQVADNSMRRVEQAQRIAQAASDKFVSSLQYQVDTFGMNEAAIQRYKATLLGAGNAASPLIAQLEQLRAAAASATPAGNITQGTHAMEGFSFATSGAKRELLVLAHELSQGNYSRFGGSMLVLAERTGAASLLFNPLTLGIIASAGALALLGAQVYKGHEEWVALADAVKATGDNTGYTQHQLDQMSVYFARSTTEIQTGREALIALIATGRFSGDQLQLVGRAALDMASYTGKSIEDVAKELAKLPDGARKWAEEYQQTNHVFTAANIELIDSLDKQGKQAEAVTALLNALDESHKRIAATMRQDKGTWDRFWDDWADGLSRIKQGMRDIGKPDSNFEQLNAALDSRAAMMSTLKTTQDRLNGSGGKDQGLKDRIEDINLQIAVNTNLIASLRAVGDTQRETAKSNAALASGGDQKIKTDKYLDGGAKSDKQKFADQIAAENKSFQETIANLSQNSADYEAVLKHHKENVAQIEAQYAKKTKVKDYADDAGTKFLQNLREQDAVIRSQLDGTNSLTGAQKEQAKFEQLILDLKGKKLTKEQESLLANQSAIRAQLAKNVADDEELRKKTEIQKLDEKSLQINQQMGSNRENRDDGYQRQLDAIGMGKSAQSQVAAINAISKEYQRYQDQLTKSTPTDLLGSDQYLAEQAKIKAGLTASLADYQGYYDSLKAKQGDWKNGANQAFADYLDSAQNVAGQVESALTSSFKGAEDAFVAFVTTGKLSFTSLVTTMLTEFARIEARKGLSSLLSLGAEALGGLLGGGISDDVVTSTRTDEMARIMGQDGSSAGISLAGARAGGGSVSSGASYLVGEKGPEIFTPPNGGTIIPNGGGNGSGGVSISLVTNVSSDGTSTTTSGSSDAQARAMGDALNSKMKQLLTQETQQGGIIWKKLQGRG